MPKDDKTAARKAFKKSARKARKPGAGRSAPARGRSLRAKPKKARKTKPARKPARGRKVKIDTPEARARLKERNLEVLKEHAPQLYQQLINFKPLSKLVVENGEPDAVFQGQYFYGGNYRDYVEKQLRNYWREPLRLPLGTLQPAQLDETAGKFLHNLLKRADEKGLRLHQRHTGTRSYFLFILGLGFGGHILDLVEKTDCRAVFVADPNLEFAYHSLEVNDWSTLFETLKKRHGRIDFCFYNSAERIADAIRRWLRTVNPMSVDGATYYYHYQNPVFTVAMKLFSKQADLILAGLGFFYDETLMLKNTHHNLFSGTERVYVRPQKPYIDVPAFIIGNGPSLDKDIPYIRENMDNAVIISSGSALRPLLKNGITPDFHMETENIEVYPLISQAAKDYDLSPVRLVTSTTVDPKAIPFFDTVLYYFRGSLSPYPIFCDNFDHCLKHPNPTVVNASLSLAQEAGVRTFYLFGADMGVKEGDLHHSKDAYHYTKGARFRHDKYNIPVPANFGGKSMTSNGLFWTLDALAASIKEIRFGRHYYNCSDGALIEGAIPLPARTLSLTTDPGKKKTAIEKIVGYFPVFTREEFDAHWNDDVIVEQMCGYLDDFARRLDRAKDFDVKDHLTELMTILDPKGVTTRAVIGPAVTYRGTLFMMMMALEFYRARLQGKKDVKAYDRIAREEIDNVVEYLRKTTIKEFGSLTRNALRKAAKKSAGKRRRAKRR